MAEQKPSKKLKPEPKPSAEQEKAKRKEAKEEPKEEKKVSWPLIAIAAAIVMVVAILAFYFFIPAITGVSFQTFKSNFESAPRVVLAVTYLNQSQFSSEVPCYTTMLEIIARTRNASSIDFLLLNHTKCEYSPTGLGTSASFKVVNASVCDEIANNEPSIFMNYSSYNYTRISAYHLYLGADAPYLASCPIAAEFG